MTCPVCDDLTSTLNSRLTDIAYPEGEKLPPNLPNPRDDGACDHLKIGEPKVSSIALTSTSEETVDLSSLPGVTVLFCYARMGALGEHICKAWDAIPGARGCTPQACSFRDAVADLQGKGVNRIFGLSTQSTEQQRALRERLGLPYALLSDKGSAFIERMRLPVFTWGKVKLLKRVMMLLVDGDIVWVHYLVFPADESANAVVAYLESEEWQQLVASRLERQGIRRCGNE
ncbi:uncharacterized protein K452DRAFT_231245 [Aplosporella prunicola CBS 121167]|uniref:Redoxin domain-containing protein n=1 Tax=Aplosporella prunicola CBS 121167 TaxID=1176127 RepID=A0A6A6B8D6_9PEZI|nr:uncharacterized protein K452DRAFT_231245 [Aplosporella prunicola CBS 121167]KAF2139818.1 hypothetical protein K452DRAFT_231245 [Aplosporella prunicola CBS 121167]